MGLWKYKLTVRNIKLETLQNWDVKFLNGHVTEVSRARYLNFECLSWEKVALQFIF